MMAADLKIDLEGFERLEKQFKPSIVRRGTNSAINKVGKKSRTAGVKETRSKYNVRAGAIKKKVKYRGSKPSTLTATITIKGSKFNVADYAGARQTKTGIVYSVVRGEKKHIPGAFMIALADMGKGPPIKKKAGSKPIARKPPKIRSKPGKKLAFKRVGANRYPIRQATDFSAPEMFEDKGLETIEKIIDDELYDRIVHDINFFQDKFGK